ncbi:thymidylate synthase ThyX [Bacteroides sp.]|uniref:thymidylate synthase ThyX n=1 Tax=Bacteroides sp. TaxID=29523 RepID=UPI0026249B03|nr:thymidylate synthase ThyX [Bacteroides sp.]MDD3041314.1 thymidylate synthase ThyX [Bacteroides sp.]
MKTKILRVKGDWLEVLNDCRATVGKDARDSIPSIDFRKRILIAEHSPIRDISIKWFWDGIKSFSATHFSRHKWECFIETQRSDRTGIPRDELPQGALVSFTGEANSQHVIDTSRKRLCYLADPDTREYWEDLKIESRKVEPELSDVSVPNCIYRGGCPEMQSCGFFEAFTKKHGMFSSIQDRYDAYNDDFYKRVKEKL